MTCAERSQSRALYHDILKLLDRRRLVNAILPYTRFRPVGERLRRRRQVQPQEENPWTDNSDGTDQSGCIRVAATNK